MVVLVQEHFMVVHGLEKFERNKITTSEYDIGESAFENCTNLISFELSKDAGKYTLGKRAFAGAENLTTVDIGASVILNDEAFIGCSSLKNIEGVILSGNRIFLGCSSLTNLEYETYNEFVFGEETFGGCTSLVEFTVPSAVKILSKKAFSGCTSLKEITIPESVNIFEENIFENCPNVVIRGIRPSYAYNYAKENNIPFELSDTSITTIARLSSE